MLSSACQLYDVLSSQSGFSDMRRITDLTGHGGSFLNALHLELDFRTCWSFSGSPS